VLPAVQFFGSDDAGGGTNCSTSVSTTQAPPSAMCAASGIPAPVEYDSVICTKTGRNCTFFDEASNCLSLGSLTTITASDPCVDLRTQSAYEYCAGAANPDGTSLDRAVVKVSSYTRNVTCPAQAAPVPPLDRSFGLANGTTIASTIGGAATNFTTKGGRAVVTYACDSTGEFCNRQFLKEIELDINDTTVMGLPFTNIRLVSSGPIPIASGNKLSSSGPGFDLSALYFGLTVKNHVNPTSTIQLTGSYTGTNFGIATSPSFQMGLFGGYTQVSGTINVAGSPGGVQINCGDFGAVAPFIADTDFSGGAEKDRSNVIDLTKVTNPAPMKVYQNQHYASPFTYTIPGFTAGSNHLIRLHFAETNPANNAPNRRKFSVAINGTTQISNLDLFATVGMNTAYIKDVYVAREQLGKVRPLVHREPRLGDDLGHRGAVDCRSGAAHSSDPIGRVCRCASCAPAPSRTQGALHALRAGRRRLLGTGAARRSRSRLRTFSLSRPRRRRARSDDHRSPRASPRRRGRPLRRRERHHRLLPVP
jgi:hypothetical protein